jgi:chemotaxis response regulator CheB
MDGHLRVVPRAGGLYQPADILFTSLAEERARRAIGVVLSGGDGDGALGIQAIKQAGGITFAQEPSSAKFPSMPKHAIETGAWISWRTLHEALHVQRVVRLGSTHSVLAETQSSFLILMSL